jgi:hypothetical protein
MRVLITGLSSYWGGRLAQVLERDDGIETIIGVSPEDPTCALERTEFVRVGTHHALLRRWPQPVHRNLEPLLPNPFHLPCRSPPCRICRC